jgi:hypothetical protein
MLRALTSLESLHLVFNTLGANELSVEGERVDIPNLRFISTTPQLFDILTKYYISFPALDHLSIEMPQMTDETPDAAADLALEHVVSTAYPGQIQHLELHGQNLTRQMISYLGPFLQKCINVAKLELDFSDVTSAMEEIAQDLSLFPSLGRLCFHGAAINNNSVKAIINSRTDSEEGLNIHELALSHCSGITLDFCDELRAGGVKVDVYC